MKSLIITAVFLLLLVQPELNAQKGRQKIKVIPDSTAVDSLEYKLIVFEPGFDAWLSMKPPMNFYSKEYYESRNRIFVVEWNYRYEHPMKYGDIYDTRIEYYQGVDYGIELNYRLYYYFRFFEETNHVKLSELFR
jgi:hypothetical protein